MIVLALSVAQKAFPAPVSGEIFHLRQPDGSTVATRIWGDEYYQVVESLDGYTLVRDPKTGQICYAGLSDDGNELVSTGVVVEKILPAHVNIEPHLRINRTASRKKSDAARARFAAGEVQALAALGGGPQMGAPSTGNVKGICLIVDFPDEAGTILPSEVVNYCNQVGYTNFGNNGSIRDYFYDVSDGNLTYTNYVSPVYYTAQNNKSYYDNPSESAGPKARELIIEALNWLDGNGFDFSEYDSNGDGLIDGINCYYAGTTSSGWAMGLWPHSWTVSFSADGVSSYKYQITYMGTSLKIGTFCHENGHMICWWPDLYDYGYESNGIGYYGLMASGSHAGGGYNPVEPCAHLKIDAGWATVTELDSNAALLPVTAGVNSFYKFPHPTLANEFYLVANRRKSGRDSAVPDAGVAIWHIDTNGSNDNEQMTPSLHYLVTLVQADGGWHLERGINSGDSTDLYDANSYDECSPLTDPNTNWWDGSASGLNINTISPLGNTMTFTFGDPAQPDGTVTLDNEYYSDNDTITITVADSDLKGNGTQAVTLDTSGGNDYEVLTLNETGSSTGIFTGSVPTAPGPVTQEDLTLQVSNGETITVRYIDADDGSGGIDVEKTDTAVVDLSPPGFAGIALANAGDGQVTVLWAAASDPAGPITYNIYRAITQGGQNFNNPLDSTEELSYIDGSAVNGTKYFYVVRATDSVGNEETNTVEASAVPQEPVVLYSFPLDTDPLWTTEAQWAFGQPTGGGGEYGSPDPTSGYTGSNVLGYNLNGDYENDLSPTKYLTMTALDCRDTTGIKLRFRRWLGVEQPLYDHAYIEVSNNGTSWQVIWENGVEVTDSSWSLVEYDISSVADNQQTVYIRWGIGTTDSSWRYCGWNIDDIEILGITAFDTDEDGLPDSWEMQYFGDLSHGPNDHDDSDSLTNYEEYLLGTDPTDANTDGDGLDDDDEVEQGSDPTIATYYVDDADGDNSYDGLLPDWDGVHGPRKTIQGGTDAAAQGEEVLVMEGAYSGAGNIDVDLGGKALAVRSVTGPLNTVIDCGNAGRAFYCLNVGQPGVVIRGFTIRNADSRQHGGAIYSEGSVITVRDCIIADSSASQNGGAIYSVSSENTRVTNCLITGNTAGKNGGAIFSGDTSLSISNCTIADNLAGVTGGGVMCDNNTSAAAIDSIFHGNTAPKGDQLSIKSPSNPSSISISYCDVQGMQGGVYIMNNCTLQWGSANIGLDPAFASGTSGDYYLSQTAAGQPSDSPCVDTGSDTAANLGLDSLTTRTDGGLDEGAVDMGYHYPAPVRITITSIERNGEHVTITWNASPGANYLVQWSTDMVIWNNTPVGTGGSWTDTNTAGYMKKLYRVREQ